MITNSESLEKEWNTFDAYLFDIDGTLVRCADAVHYFAFCDALSWVAGRPMNLDGVAAHGNTDIGILRDAFANAGIPEGEWRPRVPELCARMCRYVGERRQELCVTALRGSTETLRHLHRRGATVGAATGNLELIGRWKLEAAQLHRWIEFGGWSDGLESRTEVFARAASFARGLAGESARILVIGDTPSDVTAARANHLPVIAVASGIYGFDELTSHGPDLCLHSLDELTVCA